MGKLLPRRRAGAEHDQPVSADLTGIALCHLGAGAADLFQPVVEALISIGHGSVLVNSAPTKIDI